MDNINVTITEENINVTLAEAIIEGRGPEGPQGPKGDPGDPATNLVESVNGKQGVVVLDAADVGADPTGSASQALQDAKDYTDNEVSTLDSSLATVAKTGSYDDLSNKPTIPSIAGLATETYVDNAVAPKANTSDLRTAAFEDVEDLPVSTATQTALNAKANASDTVNLTGNQTVAGVKTFSSSPVVPTATTNTQAVNKAQMDAADALKVNKAGDTMTGQLKMTGSAANGLIRIEQGANNSNNGIRMTNAGITVGGNIYFSDASTLAVISDGALSLNGVGNRVRISGSEVISGTGFPNGVVSAPVGSTYIDTNATNGAIEWKKATGTGNTGWVVSVGDTGERNITPETLPSGIVSTSLRIQRDKNTVHLWVTNTEISSASEIILLASLPDGFRPRTTATPNQNPFAPGTSGGGGVSVNRGSVNGLRVQSIIGQFRTFYISYLTPDAWPSSLPGTAA